MNGYNAETVRKLVEMAYEDGWRDACDDHMAQRRDPEAAIGDSKLRIVDQVIQRLDPWNILGLRS